MKVVIPAGGEGNRLFPYTSLLPKTLLPIGGKPVIHWIIKNLMRHGFEEVIICIYEEYTENFRYELRNHKINVKLIKNTKNNLGSAGEILGAKEHIHGPFLLHYSDELTPIDLSELVEYHISDKNTIGTLASIKNVPVEVGVLKLRGNKLKKFIEKPMLNKPSWPGIAVLEHEIFKYIKTGDDFARDIFPRALADNKKFYIYNSPVNWIDIGSLSHYNHACKLAKEGKL